MSPDGSANPNTRHAHPTDALRSARGPNRSWRFVLGCLAIAACATFAFWPALQGSFLWDDHSEIVANAEIKAPDGLAKIWRGEGTLDYFPLKTTLQWVQWRLWQERPLGYHVTNLALHILGAILVWRLLEKLGLRFGWIGGLLFAVHPLAVESTAWIAELKNVLSLPPLLLAAIAFVDFDAHRRRADYLAALGWFVIALLSKTTVVMFPPLLVVFVWWRRQRLTAADARVLAPFFLASLAFGLVAIRFQHQNAIGHWHIEAGGIMERLGRGGLALCFYALKTLVPINLLPLYPRAVVEGPVWLEALAWAAAAAGAILSWRRRTTWGRHALLGLSWFVFSLLPVLGLIDMSFLYFAWVADHFAYLSLVAFAGAMAAVAGLLPRAGALALLGLAGLFIAQTRQHAAHFVSEEKLWRYTLVHNPDAWLAHSNLASALLVRGEAREALASAQRAAELKPDYGSAHRNVAAALVRLGDLDGAAAALARAGAHEKPVAEFHVQLAAALLRAGRLDDAIRHARIAVDATPTFFPARQHLAIALYLAGRPAEALPHYEAALQLAPDAETRTNYGVALAAAGRWRDAIAQYQVALRQEPRSVNAHFSLGIALAHEQRHPEARREFERTLELNPSHAEAWFYLGEDARRTGEPARALQAYREALRLRPDFPEARAALDNLPREAKP